MSSKSSLKSLLNIYVFMGDPIESSDFSRFFISAVLIFSLLVLLLIFFILNSLAFIASLILDRPVLIALFSFLRFESLSLSTSSLHDWFPAHLSSIYALDN